MEAAVTPMLKQYLDIKLRHQDCILFFRLGDFYEMFFEDAKQASVILDLVLTARGQDSTGKIPMCGIPFHAADNYIGKLIKAGKKVAICEQTEDPHAASAKGGSASGGKGLVKRDVIRVISAGTYLDEVTDSRYILCLSPSKSGTFGFSFCDTSGGSISTNVLKNAQEAVELLSKLPIVECVFPEGSEETINALFAHPLLKQKNILRSPFADWCFNPELAKKELCTHLGVLNLNGFGIEELPQAQAACAALLEYLRGMNKTPLKHLNSINLYTNDDYVLVSPAAHYGLELDDVCTALDLTQTPFGRRLFRFWLFHPLKNVAAIKERQDAVAFFNKNLSLSQRLNELFQSFPDIEKALSRLSCQCSSVKDLLSLRQGLLRAPLIAELLQNIQHPLLKVTDIRTLRENLTKTINPDVPLAKPEGKIIQTGIDPDLDSLRESQENGRRWLAEFQAREIKKSGINSLKVGFNNVFGYYIEISKANQKNVPSDYIRKQTLVNGERYITPELKEYEEKILTAQDKIAAIERRIIDALTQEILDQSTAIYAYAKSLGISDCLLSLSKLFSWGKNSDAPYVLPVISDDDTIDIKDGRHPIVEKSIAEQFTPNDTLLNTRDQQLIILTGPNMAGKSTYIRQSALLVMMAQMGAPIPAREARIGITDKIFTRIGAHDDISKGQSTFMVEMTETAHILNNLTPRSLVILDEIGRGTSTTDGLCLAWALAEYVHTKKVRTLFATHFHELVALSDRLDGVKNYNVAVKEWKDKIIFLHKIIPGGSDDSYGIYVAKLAGIPESVIKRSKEILSELEIGTPTPYKKNDSQLNLFSPVTNSNLDEIKTLLEEININNITPLEALKKLSELKEKL